MILAPKITASAIEIMNTGLIQITHTALWYLGKLKVFVKLFLILKNDFS